MSHLTLRDSTLNLQNLRIRVNSIKVFDHINIETTDHKAIAKIVAETLSQNNDIMESLKTTQRLLKEYGFSVLEGFDFHSLAPNTRKQFLLGIWQLLGDVTYTDEILKVAIWDIKPRKESLNQNKTISEVAWEACFHTDTQYYPNPEKYFILACDTPANDGGESWLIDWVKLVNDIKENDKLLYNKLLNLKFPFAVPSSFTRSWTDNSIEIYLAPIIQEDKEPLLRFREDTIERWSKLIPSLYWQQHQEAFDQIKKYLNQDYRLLRFDLERNQILIVNNHELLHWRWHFTDMNRLLYRVRMN